MRESLMKIINKCLASSLLKSFLVIIASATLIACGSNSSKDEVIEPTPVSSETESTTVATPVDSADTMDVDNLSQNLESVFYFGYDQALLTTATRIALDEQVAILRRNNVNVRLEGHADERGSREYNLALGERRAKAVADYLVINGISRSRIEVVSYGEEQPVSFGSDEASYRLNRRVELK